MREQFKALGFAFSWERELTTCDESYYGLEQRIFLDFYHKGLAYQSETWVNWDPVEQTVLANEQVVNGCGWRSGVPVEKKRLRQWSLKITNYADELLKGLENLPKWPEKIRKMQQNWIGKSKGALIHFKLSNGDRVEVFSVCPEVIYGASFVALAPTHPLVENLAKNEDSLTAFVKECQQISTAEADIVTAEKKGYKTALHAFHPLTGEELPLYVANFVLMDYGTGAIFGCPGHDERDFEFATKYGLPLKKVIENDRILVNSGELDGLVIDEARLKAIDLLTQKGFGEAKEMYRMRDWGISRQRYWGCPIPMVSCDDCGVVPVKEADLPVTLPDNPDFSKPGNPLEHHLTWKYTMCPKCGGPAVRETDTLDTFFESSWYFLRFLDPQFKDPINKDQVDRLMPVDTYVGGSEHAVMHLLYARFFVKALRDCGYIDCDEPFTELLTQGMVCHQTFKDAYGKWVEPSDVIKDKEGSYGLRDGSKVTPGPFEKMSKSKKNIVDPLYIIDSYGADAARLFVLSDTPYYRDFDWNDDSLDGAWRYLSKIHRVGERVFLLSKQELVSEDKEASLALSKATHRYMKNVTDTYARYGFNKVLAFHRDFCRIVEEYLDKPVNSDVLDRAWTVLLITLSPIAPHLASELWEKRGEETFLHDVAWPTFDDALAALDEITMAVQINGKTRDSIQVTPNADDENVKEKALSLSTVERYIGGKEVRRVIIVPGRIINIVVC